MLFGWLGRGFARLGALVRGGSVPATAILLENSDPLLTETGDFLLTES